MKIIVDRRLPSIGSIAGLCLLALSSPASAESILGYWDFNDGFAVDDDTVQIVHDATLGLGTIFQQRADKDGNGKIGHAYTNARFGIDSIDGKAMGWNDIKKSGPSDAELFIEFPTVGFKDVRIRFDILGNTEGDPITSYDLKYGTETLVDVTDDEVTGTIKDFLNGESIDFVNDAPLVDNDIDFVEITVDLSSVSALNNQSTVAIRFDDFHETGNNAMAIDNLLITGTAVPEPGSIAALAIGAIGLVAGRRRRQV